MKLKITLLSFFIFSASLFSQRITIEWDGAKIQDYGETKINLPSFKNDGFSYRQSNIFIQTKQRVGEKEVKVNNLSWQPVGIKELYELNANNLSDKDVADVSYYTSEGVEYASIAVGLFKNMNGKIFRLASYDIIESGTRTQGSAMKVGSTVNPLS